jgi:hypothetical protein
VQQVLAPKQVCPVGQQSPAQVAFVHVHVPFALQVWSGSGQLPGHGWPQPSGAPHGLPEHAGWHWQVPLWQISCAPAQVPLHLPLQPSASPHAAPAQSGAHAHTPLWQISPAGQSPLHLPPQPSGSPQSLSAQSGVHATQWLSTHTLGGVQLQSQVSWQAPFTHTWPG